MRCLGVMVLVAGACGNPTSGPTDAVIENHDAVADAADAAGAPDAADALDASPDAHNVLSPDPADPSSVPCSGRLGFPTLPSVVATGGAAQIAVADIDGDGDMDIDYATGFDVVSVRGNGNGTFGASVSTTLGANAGELIALADMNGDGRPDRITAGSIGTQPVLWIWLNDGTGTFGVPQDYALGSSIVDTDIADVNGDGKSDVITLSGDKATVMLNTGSGLAAPQPYDVEVGSRMLAAADLNGDNRPELVVTNGGSGVSVLRNLGNGAFAPPVTYPTELDPWAIAVGDVNEDGRVDVMVGVGSNQTPAVDVLLNTGGSLAAPQRVPVGSAFAPRLLSVGDANGDGHLDLLSSDSLQTGVTLLVGTGTGTFNVVPLETNDVPFTATFANLNGDSRADLLVGTTYITPYLGRAGSMPYELRTILPVQGWIQSIGARAIDLSSDGKLDLVAAGSGQSSELAVSLGLGGGQFGPQSLTSVPSVRHMIPADLDNDQRQDLVVIGTAVQSMRNAGNGALTTVTSIPLTQSPTHAIVGDLDGDGLRDVVVGLQSPNGKLIMLRGLGAGQLAPPIVLWSAYHVIGAALIDLDLDGRLDLLIDDNPSPTSSARHVLRSLGNGMFATPIDTSLAIGGRHYVHDVNEDGKADLISVSQFEVRVSLGTGTLTLGSAVSLPFAGILTAEEASFADVNGDGHVDLLVAGTAIAVFLGHGDGSFEPPAYYQSGYTHTVSVADLDGDGRVDFLVEGGSNRSMMIMQGRCP